MSTLSRTRVNKTHQEFIPKTIKHVDVKIETAPGPNTPQSGPKTKPQEEAQPLLKQLVLRYDCSWLGITIPDPFSLSRDPGSKNL